MRKVKLLQDWMRHGKGSTLEVEELTAGRLVRDGFAEWADDETPAAKMKRGTKPSRTKASAV